MIVAVNLGSSVPPQDLRVGSPSYYNQELISGITWL